MDIEQAAIERLKMASEMSLRLYKQPLVITYSGGKDSDVLLHLAGKAGIQYRDKETNQTWCNYSTERMETSANWYCPHRKRREG